MLTWLWGGGLVAVAQTVQQSETSIGYLKRKACLEEDGLGGHLYLAGGPATCVIDEDCPAPARCLHESLVVPPEQLFPRLEFLDTPYRGGSGEGIVRFVPLCDDGSGDHEYSVSQGSLGTPPTCLPEDFIRCADGSRPYFHVDASTSAPRSVDYLLHVGVGGPASVPYQGDPIWAKIQGDSGRAYNASPRPPILQGFDGIYSADPINPFSQWNRVSPVRCSADSWYGNADATGVSDFTQGQVVSLQASYNCHDANRDGVASCEDNLTLPGACDCRTGYLEPPATADHTYSVFYHGRRIVRAVLADLGHGAVGYRNYPLVDDGSGQARVQPGDEALPRILPGARVALTCHSSGCSALQGGLLDELHAWLDLASGGDVDVRAVFNGDGSPAMEVEACVSEFGGLDRFPRDGVPDLEARIDETCSYYDGVVDTVSINGEPMSSANFQPGGWVAYELESYYDGTRVGYRPPVDASCLAHHCPGSTGWADDPMCAPCLDHRHVLYNHLQTPFVYHQALRDHSCISSGGLYCDTAPGVPCDHNGDASRKDFSSTHWRQLTRKLFADVFRYAETDRCEGGVGQEAPYDHLLLLLPDREIHAPVLDDATALLRLDPAGAMPPTSLGMAIWTWMTTTSPAAPGKLLCSQERWAGENASDFTAGGVPGCL